MTTLEQKTKTLSILTKRQIKKIDKPINNDSEAKRIIVDIRYDDQCSNGHNSFSITGSLYDHPTSTSDRHTIMCGCIHDSIVKYCPELKYLIKWHLTSSDEPMYYVANTTYHARTTDTEGYQTGEVTATTTHLYFDNIPFSFTEQKKEFWEYLDSVNDFNTIEVEHIKYDGLDSYDFCNNYSLTGFIKSNESKKWYKAPFKNKTDAHEFLEALQTHNYSYIKTPSTWAKAVQPNIDAARNSAIWPNATLKQLQDEKQLLERLPALMANFKKDMESLNFIY